MDIRHLRTFVTVARMGSVTKAAEALHITQPAVSGQLKSLEEALELKLLSRTTSSVALTQAGQDLLLQAERALDAFGDFLHHAKARRGQVSGQLRIGVAMYDPVMLRVGPLMRRATEEYPGLRVDMQVGRISWFHDALRSSEIDGAISVCRTAMPGIDELVLREMVFELVIPSAWHDRLGADPLQALSRLPWIRMSPRSAHHAMMQEILQTLGMRPVETVEADHEAVIHALVAAEVGVGLLRSDLAQASEEAGTIRRLPAYSAAARLSFIYPTERRNDPAMGALLNTLTKVWRL
ncbi:LysR family transcriptional regulator [Azoarcus sp. DN11]|uniref:LysR family transcriptional regulator n=1 Tax=Azoarcus sp. DN11 TaxID=356837 RepID=UPI000EB23590|nr:LysR family transcriptional regulator [Azoarcus sp. DN11]AYH43939.1 LysR family transcriptional regulator [Azoarcus sp. DN11]